MLSLFVFYSLVHLLLYGAPQVFFFNFLTQLSWVITVVILLISSGHFPDTCCYAVIEYYWLRAFANSRLFSCCLYHFSTVLMWLSYSPVKQLDINVTSILFYTAQCIVVLWIKRCTYLLAFARWLSMRNKFYAHIYYNTNHFFRALVFESTYLLYRFKQLPSNLTFKLNWD